ncbi:MAG: phytanoyl-CoA dioxygenase family protein [Pseudomonadota bacterium]
MAVQNPEAGTDQPFLQGDNAGKYRFTHSDAINKVASEQLRADLEAVKRDGYLVIEKLLSDAEIAALKAASEPLLDKQGRNDFEGMKTQRAYALLAKTRAFDRLVDHPRILALLDSLFLPNYLLSQCLLINILPGESAQDLHCDDGFYPIPKPRPAYGAATVWAIDEFTADNGATSIVPGSHTWGDDRIPTEADAKPAVMPAGSVVFYPGTFWHGGGANRSDNARLAITCQYCEPWLRTQENFFLSTPHEVVAEVSEDIRRMLGYSIHPPFGGMVNGMHPKRLLEKYWEA